MTHEDNELTILLKGLGLALLWLISFVAANYHEIMGNVFITLSVAFLVYKFIREIKKNKSDGK